MNEPRKIFLIRGGLRHPEPERDCENIEARLDPDSDLVVLTVPITTVEVHVPQENNRTVVLPTPPLEVVLSVDEIWQLYQWASERLLWEDIYAREDNQDD